MSNKEIGPKKPSFIGTTENKPDGLVSGVVQNDLGSRNISVGDKGIDKAALFAEKMREIWKKYLLHDGKSETRRGDY